MNALSKSGQCHSSLKLTSRTFLQRLNCLGSANSARSVQMFLKEKEDEESEEGGMWDIFRVYGDPHHPDQSQCDRPTRQHCNHSAPLILLLLISLLLLFSLLLPPPPSPSPLCQSEDNICPPRLVCLL